MSETNGSNGEQKVQHLILDGTRKLLLAGLGAVMMAQDELSQMTERFVERGEIEQEKGRERIDKFVADRRKRAKKAGKDAEKEFDKRMEGFLHRMNIPTRSEIRGLSTKITRLSKQVDELK